MTKAKIYSRRYERLMQKPWEKRHTLRNQKRYGVWRWRGMYEYRGFIVPLLERADGIIDFGGALGPLGFGSLIVDKQKPIVRTPAPFRYCENIPTHGSMDVVFSSHTLEHVGDLAQTLGDLYARLCDDGHFIFHLPSDRNAKHWHPMHRAEHKRLFTLRDSYDPAMVRIDKVLESMGMDVEVAEYCRDSSIMLIARK